ncbi:MAG: ATP-dependent helicase [Candidatus Nomurabacteria bacterium]|jgi:DNA helicase-2/ATP-dependent DNA helicase PcrA|nr:ATP-dependent helicase [Candidatus Nomurabacteria bacterium]
MFEEKYQQLNKAQKQAVDKIDGPLMVVAGPGTGKTQLLSMRVANILRQTDMLPSNVLCLTFTDAASTNMTERMASMMGGEAYKVPVFTFHAFCQHVMDRYPEYFWNGAAFSAADELTQTEVLASILRHLPHSNDLSKFYNDEFIYLGAITSAISDIKRAGVLSKDLRKIVDQNAHFIHFSNQFLNHLFPNPTPRSKDGINTYLKHFKHAHWELGRYVELAKPDITLTLSHTVLAAMSAAIQATEAEEKPTTKHLTTFKKQFIEATPDGGQTLIDGRQGERIKQLADVYEKYLGEMEKRKLYDFDDMILQVLTVLKEHRELRQNLQEQYQYILVDEFQDTNGAQMQILQLLTDYDDTPNIMAVGDFKQAIYRFQGAEVANIERFAKRYGDKLTVIELTENYRSSGKILEAATVAIKDVLRHNFFANMSHELVARNTEVTTVAQVTAPDLPSELAWVASKIAELKEAGAELSGIAVIAKKHKHLAELVPYLNEKSLPIQYEKEQDVLNSPPVEQLVLLARVCVHISRQELDIANTFVPRILAHPAWGLSAEEIWHIAIDAQYKNWLSIMLEQDLNLANIASKIMNLAKDAENTTLEESLDALFEPYREYFFSAEKLEQDPEAYLGYLSDLSALRQLTRDYKGKDNLKLTDLIDLLEAYKKAGKDITSTRQYLSGERVQLMSAHKAKGLEFNIVFIINGTNDVWAKGFGAKNKIRFPSNMPFSTDDSDDEQARLFYVAMTRARNQLYITTHKFNSKCKELLPCSYLTDANIERITLPPNSTTEQITNLRTSWQTRIVSADATLKNLLAPTLASYQLSATHLNSFVDLEYAGPQSFLLNTLLHFPYAVSANASYGTAIHNTIKQIHLALNAKKKKPSANEVAKIFEAELSKAHLNEADFKYLLKKGKDDLTVFVNQFEFKPEQVSERDFRTDNITWQGTRLTGTVDMLVKDTEKKTVTIYDYKTGKPFADWERNSKLHKYEQQLMFYKLLVENSAEFTGYTVEKGVLQFVEPVDGKIVSLETDYPANDMHAFKSLVRAVWKCIQDLDLPDTSAYGEGLGGTLDFERFLVKGY